MKREDAPVLVFVIALVAWGVGFSLLLGSMGCGGGPRRCADTMATDRRMGQDPCREDGR